MKYQRVPAHTAEDDVSLVVPPLERVGLGHGDESEQTRPLTLPPAAPVFATQPAKGNIRPQVEFVSQIFGVAA